MNADLRAKVRGWLTPIHWRDGLMAAPALIVILLVGIAMDLQVHAVVAAGAALSVGFGASRTFFSLRCGATIAAALGTAAAAMAGSLLGGHELPYLIGCAVLAGGNAAFATRDQTVWWLALQVAIAFLIAGHFPGTLAQATLRAELVLLGGAIQIAIVMTLDRIIPYDRRTPPPPNAAASEPIAPFVIRAAICVPLALVVARSMHIENEYWAPMTALLVLKPGLRDTQWRGAMRIGGTIAGSAAASGLALAFSSHPVLIAFTTGIASAGAFALPRANYAMFGFAVTLTAVLLIDLAQGDPLSNSKHRIVATIVGGLVALAIAWLGPRSPRAKPIDS